jgi:hypothetical protein
LEPQQTEEAKRQNTPSTRSCGRADVQLILYSARYEPIVKPRHPIRLGGGFGSQMQAKVRQLVKNLNFTQNPPVFEKRRMQGFLIEATILVACLVIALTAETTALP